MSEPLSTPPVTSSISGYNLLEGIDGSSVYRGKDAKGYDVAIKTLPVKRGTDQYSKLLADLNSAKVLDHRNIVGIRDILIDDGLAVVMDYVSDCFSLEHTLANPLPSQPDFYLELLRQSAEALDSAHRQGLLHGNFDASRILFPVFSPNTSGALRARITGFGLATLAPSRDGQEPSKQADLSALALCGYRILSGARPVACDLDMLDGDGEIDPDVRDVLSRAAGKGPGQPYGSCTDFVTALQQAFHDVQLRQSRDAEDKRRFEEWMEKWTLPPEEDSRAASVPHKDNPRWARLKKGPMWAGAVVVLLLLLFLVWSKVFPSRPESLERPSAPVSQQVSPPPPAAITKEPEPTPPPPPREKSKPAKPDGGANKRQEGPQRKLQIIPSEPDPIAPKQKM